MWGRRILRECDHSLTPLAWSCPLDAKGTLLSASQLRAAREQDRLGVLFALRQEANTQAENGTTDKDPG